VRDDDQPVDLLVARIGEREYRPVHPGFARRHLDAPDDAVGARRGRDLDAVALTDRPLDRIAEIDRGHVEAYVHRLDGVSGRADQRRDHDSRRQGGPQETQETTLPVTRAKPVPGHRRIARNPQSIHLVPISRRSGMSEG